MRDVDLTAAAVATLQCAGGLTRSWPAAGYGTIAGRSPGNRNTSSGKAWMPLCKRAGVRYRNPYQLRHTYASTRLTAGANPYWLANQMGHVDVEMVFKIYGKFIPANYRRSGAFAPDSHGEVGTAGRATVKS